VSETTDVSTSFYLKYRKIEDFGIERIDKIVYLLIAVLSLDTLINVLSSGLGVRVSSPEGVTLFFIICGTTIICQLFVLQFVSRTSLAIRRRVRHIRLMHAAVIISQCFLILVMVYVMAEVAVTVSYSSISSILVTISSYMMSISLMGIFTVTFLRWYKSNRTSILVLLYGLSFATVVIVSSVLLLLWIYLFDEQMPAKILPATEPTYFQSEEGSIWKIFSKTYQYIDIVGFFLKWGGTALILYHYSHKMGKIKYWFLLSLPLVYFSLTVIVYHLHIYEPHDELESLIFFGIASLNSTFGGILFYLAFKLSSESFSRNKVFRNYLLMAGYGFMVFFSATQSNIIATVYPPFGFATVSSFGLGSYLILIGLYLSALSVSQDENLRNMIKRSTLSESKFLNSIGTSALERDKVIVSTVLDKTKRQQEEITKDIGIGTSLSEEDVKEYVREVERKEESKENH
jgi:hypothetical protein